MFQPTTIFALLALTTSTFSAPIELEKRSPVAAIQKRYTCFPDVPVGDCNAKTGFMNRCLMEKILSEKECYEQSQTITAAMNDLINTPLQKRYQCLPTIPAEDCTAKSEYFSRCVAAKILPDRQCYELSQNVTATTTELVIPANPIPYTLPGLEASPIPTKPATSDHVTIPLQKRYECLPTVPALDCTAKAAYFNRCLTEGKLAEKECYEQSQKVTATTTVFTVPVDVTPIPGDLEASPIPVNPDTFTFSLDKRYECLPTVPALDCNAKSEYFNRCVAEGKLAEKECYELSQKVTATTHEFTIPLNPVIPGDLEASPIPVKPDTLVK